MMAMSVGGGSAGYFPTVSPFSLGREAEARLKIDVSALNRKLSDKSDKKITCCKK